MTRVICFLLALNPSILIQAAEIKEDQKIVFIGDSLTAGYGLSSENAYPALIQNKLNQMYPGQYQVLNMGISGSTSQSALGRVQWALKLKPEWIVLALGANDGLRGLSPKEMKKNLSQAIEVAQNEKVKILLCGMKIPLNMGEQYRKEFESVFPEIAKKYQLPFIPFLLKDVAGKTKLNQTDGIHPNEKGYRTVSVTVLKVLKTELEKKKK